MDNNDPSSSSSKATRVHRAASQDQANREALLADHRRKRSNKKSSSSSNDNSTMAEATDIQQSLSRTQALLGNELQLVSHMASAIDDDGHRLEETMKEHATMNVSKAQQALKNLQRAQQREERLLLGSIVFFVLVVIYIFWARVILHLPLIDTTIYAVRGLVKKVFQ